MRRRGPFSIGCLRCRPRLGWRRPRAPFASGRDENVCQYGGVLCSTLAKGGEPMAITGDTTLIRQALAYVIELCHELTEEKGAPTLGTQNQVVDFDEATTDLPSHLRRDGAYRRISAYLQSVMGQPVFARPGSVPAIGAD